MRAWFATLEEREQVFVAAGGLLLVLAIIYAFIWVPLDNGHKSLSASVATWQRSLAEIKSLKGMQATPATNRAPRVDSGQSPVVIVDQTLQTRSLGRSLKRSQPTTSNGIRVEFENVAFDDLVLWLGDLSRQYGMHVTSGSISTSSQAGPGRINATFTLERA